MAMNHEQREAWLKANLALVQWNFLNDLLPSENETISEDGQSQISAAMTSLESDFTNNDEDRRSPPQPTPQNFPPTF